QLTAVLTIVRHGTFHRAADALGVSQPALSKTISLLERRIGYKVFERGARGVKLTEIGQIVVRRAEQLDLLLARMREELSLFSQHREGPLVVGTTPSMMLGLVPEALARLGVSHPNLVVRLVEALDDQLTPALERGEIDLLVGPVLGLHPAAP